MRNRAALLLVLLALALPACRKKKSAAQEYGEAVGLLQKNDLEGAAKGFRKVLDREPAHAGAHQELAGVLQRQGKHVDAIAEYEAAARGEAPNANLLNSLGVLYQATGRPTRAVETFLQGISIDPKMPILRYNLGFALEQMGERASAAAAYEAYLDLTPKAAGDPGLKERIRALRSPSSPSRR